MKISSCSILEDETILHQRPDDKDVNDYNSPYGFQQWAKPYSIVNNKMPQSEHEYATVVHDWLIDTCFTTCSKEGMPIQNDNNAR